MITPASLRADFPEFSDTTVYPDAQIAYWIAYAGLAMNQSIWGCPAPAPASSPPTTQYDLALEQFVCHHLVLEARAQAEAAKGAPPGVVTGPVTSKGVGPVSVGYATTEATEEGGGHWNTTIYGTRFYRAAKMFGNRPFYIGPCAAAFGPLLLVPQGPPWWGPTVDLGITTE